MAAAAPSPLASSVEKTNGAKLSRLLIDGGTTVLRNVFDSYHPPANLAADLNANYLTLNNLLRRRVLHRAQWDLLFPPGGAAPDSNTFDITLLFLLLTNICGLSPSLSGWHSKPPPSDTSIEANLVRIKFFRNELYGHVSSTDVDTPTFNALWLEISAVLVSLGLNHAEIDRLKEEHCKEEDYIDVLSDWAEIEEDIKSQLKDIHQYQTKTAAPSPLASSAEKASGAKLSRLLIDGGTTVLKNVFDSYHPPANLAADLNANYRTLNNLLKKRVLYRAQWDQLFPPGGAAPDSKTFDINLLFLLLTNICGLSPPLSGWHSKPLPSDTSFEANLVRIKVFRNEVYVNLTTTAVDTVTFNNLWQEICAVFVALGLNQAEIDRLKAEHFVEEDYLHVLLDWSDSGKDIKSQLKDIHQYQTKTAAPSPLASSAEKANGAKLSRLLIDGGTTVLRNVFDSYHPPANLAADLNANYPTLNKLLRRRVLHRAQWDQLFPPDGATPDSKTFDITLLFLLLTNICRLAPPLTGWHTRPPPSDTTLEANIARIKFFRNAFFGNLTTTGVDTPTFNALWLEISVVLVALGLNQAEIDRLKAEGYEQVFWVKGDVNKSEVHPTQHGNLQAIREKVMEVPRQEHPQIQEKKEGVEDEVSRRELGNLDVKESEEAELPPEIRAQGPRAELAYQNALQNGKVKLYRGRIMLIGQECAGKTSLKKSLLGMPFDPGEERTVGVEVDPSKFEVNVDQVKNWQRTEQKKLDNPMFLEDIARIVVKNLNESDPEDIHGMDSVLQTAEGYRQSEPSLTEEATQDTKRDNNVEIVSPTMHALESTPDTNKEINMGIDEQSQPAVPDIQLSFDSTVLLQKDVTELVIQHLKGLKLEEDIKAKEVILTVWDFAGQHIYYATHPVFLSPRAVYLLVFNHSKDLGAKPESRARQGTHDIVWDTPTNETNLDDLLSWLVSVHCIRPTTDVDGKESGNQEKNLPYIRPPVLIVGTHADQPFEDTKEMQKTIERNISGKSFQKHLARPALFSVDNEKRPVDERVKALQKKIKEVLEQEPYMGEEVPIRWFFFEKVVEELVAKKIYHMGLVQLLKVARQVCHIDDEEELKAMLNFYHDLGVIVKHDGTVVLQAQWLIDLFKQLIVVPQFNEAESKYAEDWEKLENSGHLSMDLVNHVFDKLIQEGLSKQDILGMMELYGLIVKLTGGVTDEPRYIVPAQLKSSPSGLCETKLSYCDPCPLYLHFPDGFVPHGLFPQLLSKCISWCSDRGPKEDPILFQNGARLLIGVKPIYYLILICRKRFIKVMLKQKNPDSSSTPTASSDKACEVRVFLEGTLQDMSRKLSWLRKLRYELCVACTHCLNCGDQCAKHRSVCCTHDDCLRLLPLRPKEQMICPVNYGDEPIAPVGMEKWLLDHETELPSHPSIAFTPPGASYTRQEVHVGAKKMFEQEDPLCSTSMTLKVTLLGDEWSSSAGGLSTLNRELAIHLAEQPKVEVTFLVPEGKCTDEHKKAAQRCGITVVETEKRAGYEPLDWLICPPHYLSVDVVIGHGMKIGRQAQFLRDARLCNCKWVQVVHTAPEQLGMFKSHSDAISRGEKKHETEVHLCKLADLVVPIGHKLAEAYSSYLRCREDQDIFPFTPGLFREFADLKQNANDSSELKVLLCGRGDAEDFELKGYDIAAKAFADQELNGEPYRLLFVGAPDGKQDEVARKLRNCGIADEQLTVRKFIESREKMKDLFYEVDLAIMPSRTEGFGLIALEALSAGLPILVSGNSGFARALQTLQFDNLCIVESKEPKDWAKAIKAVRAKHGEQLQEIRMLRDAYGKEFSWEKQCADLVAKMRNMVHGIN